VFKQVFGANVFNLPPQQVIPLIGSALAAWESSPEVVPFSSKYDAYLAGMVQLSPSELNGLKLATGSTTGRPGGPAYKNATCAQCHTIPAVAGNGPDLWSSFAYLNTGVPRNPNNPYYTQVNQQTNPLGYNPLGAAYIDYGLGDFLYPSKGLPIANTGAGSNGQGDFLAINGTFKTPTLRNSNKRPNAGFVKAYGHNGFFKSLQQLVHFYNTRNLTTQPGEVIDFTRPNPYAGLVGQPLWPTPEYPGSTLRNPTGAAGQIGNLGLAPQEEADLVNFLATLSDQ
jgi:cytochrome c peroxidase